MRTQLQHEWADMFEKFADRAGREIRYGAPPDHWQTEAQRAASPPVLLDFYRAAYRVRETAVELALAFADLIAAVEEAEAAGAENPRLDSYRETAATGLAELRSKIESWGSDAEAVDGW